MRRLLDMRVDRVYVRKHGADGLSKRKQATLQVLFPVALVELQPKIGICFRGTGNAGLGGREGRLPRECVHCVAERPGLTGRRRRSGLSTHPHTS